MMRQSGISVGEYSTGARQTTNKGKMNGCMLDVVLLDAEIRSRHTHTLTQRITPMRSDLGMSRFDQSVIDLRLKDRCGIILHHNQFPLLVEISPLIRHRDNMARMHAFLSRDTRFIPRHPQ